MKKKTIIIMAGGTGGHIFPGIEIALSLIKKGWKVFWLGTSKNIEAQLIPKYGITIKFIDICGFKGKHWLHCITIPLKLIKACYQAKLIIKKINPDIVLGMGGYTSVPGSIIAYLFKKPLLIHEQNRIAGLANKLLSKFATIIMQAFPNTILNSKTITVGNPIRKSIINIKQPLIRFKNRSGALRILILGGSQGSNIFNYVFPKVSIILKEKIQLWHQVGIKHIEQMIKIYNSIHTNIYKLTPFIENISEAYSWADLIICRAGALTVSEIQYIGLPAIFIPFPHKDQHQYWNAFPLKMIKGAKIIIQSKFTVEIIIKTINKINRKKLITMSNNLNCYPKQNSTKKITNLIEKIVS